MEDFKNRLLKYIEGHLKISVRSFEERCGLTNGTVGAIKIKGPSAENLSKISYTYPELNLNWLVSGRGNMLNERHDIVDKSARIPLLPFAAVAGWMTDNNGVDAFVDSMVFADFSARGADCAIRVDGDSMYPRYKSGDILAIKILKDPSFFQWGRVYVLNTTQGCVVKKLFPCDEEDRIICHSENSSNYPDYKIMKQDILGVAIVVGHAGVE